MIEPESEKREFLNGCGELLHEWSLNGKQHRTNGPAVIFYKIADNDISYKIEERYIENGEILRCLYYRKNGSIYQEYNSKNNYVDSSLPYRIEYDFDGNVKREHYRIESSKTLIKLFDSDGTVRTRISYF